MIVLYNRLFDSNGNEQAEVAEKIMQLCSGKKVQIVVNAKPKNEFYRFAKYIALFAKYGIQARLVDLTQDSLSFNEVILLDGGSPRLLMEVIKKTGCEREIVEIYKNTGLILGQSAGAMALMQQFVDDKGEFGGDLTCLKV